MMKTTISAALLSGAPLSEALISRQSQEMVHWHNKARSEIAQLGVCANMLEIVWSPVLAQVARDYVNDCTEVLQGKFSIGLL